MQTVDKDLLALWEEVLDLLDYVVVHLCRLFLNLLLDSPNSPKCSENDLNSMARTTLLKATSFAEYFLPVWNSLLEGFPRNIAIKVFS